MKKILILTALIVLVSIAGLGQQVRENKIQNHRIERGVISGQINRVERLQIRKNQFRYNLEQKKARRDGMVTPGETRKLKMMKRKNDIQIFRMKHNKRKRVI